MMPNAFYEERKRAKAQARQMRTMAPERISVDTWLGGYRHLFPETRSEGTIQEHIIMLRPFRRAHGAERMSEITAMTAQAWALKHPAQVKLLRQAWAKAVVMRVAPFNVWAIVEKPPREKPRVRPPTGSELSAALWLAAGGLEFAGSPQGLMPTSLSDLILTAAYSGARQSGLLAVRRSHVDLEAGRMTVTEKGEKTRQVLLLGPSIDAIGRQMRRRPLGGSLGNDPVLWKMPAKTLQKQWRAVRGDFPHGFHSLRHFHATWLAERGVDALDIAVQLGHTDSEGRPYERHVRRVYEHPDPELALARIAASVRGS